jgi:hypothetical protein
VCELTVRVSAILASGVALAMIRYLLKQLPTRQRINTLRAHATRGGDALIVRQQHPRTALANTLENDNRVSKESHVKHWQFQLDVAEVSRAIRQPFTARFEEEKLTLVQT